MGLADEVDDVLAAHCACTACLSYCCGHIIAFLCETECAALQGLTNPP